jgi:hypothetical protein
MAIGPYCFAHAKQYGCGYFGGAKITGDFVSPVILPGLEQWTIWLRQITSLNFPAPVTDN